MQCALYIKYNDKLKTKIILCGDGSTYSAANEKKCIYAIFVDPDMLSFF